ncbi:MAG TPA: hypothetical protein VI643_02235 [Planctomycetota bacterium]|nr:hypothetical protein [Planctomycetota bacterium]
MNRLWALSVFALLLAPVGSAQDAQPGVCPKFNQCKEADSKDKVACPKCEKSKISKGFAFCASCAKKDEVCSRCGLPKTARARPARPPSESKKYSAAIKKALDFLAGKQEANGRIPGATWKLRYVQSDSHITDVMTTAIAGLAFLANGSTAKEGPYSQHLVKIRGYLDERIKDIIQNNSAKIGAGGGPVYSATLSLHFFVHLYEQGKSASDKDVVTALVQFVSNAMGTEIGTSTWKKGKDTGTVWFISGVTALVNSCIISLTRAKSAGFQVQDTVFGLAKKYFASIAEPDGSFKYDQHNMFPEEPRPGRSIASVFALMGMGVPLEKEFKAQLDYARRNVANTMSHHTPSLHMTLCAFAFYALGRKDWEAYVPATYDKLVARQKEDGSLDKIWDVPKELRMTPNDMEFGPTYATANFALILQVPERRVRLQAVERE